VRESNVLSRAVTTLYAGLLAVFFGEVVLDVVYARLLDRTGGFAGLAAVYAHVSDFLLLLGAPTLLLAFLAIAAAWSSRAARAPLLASAFLLGVEFLAPMLLAPALRGPESAWPAGFGAGVRLVPLALAALLAFAGLGRLSGGAISARDQAR
jgi:hypothetical protein